MHVCVPDTQWGNTNRNAGVWSKERLIAGSFKERSGLYPPNPWSVSAKHLSRPGEGAVWLVVANFLVLESFVFEAIHTGKPPTRKMSFSILQLFISMLMGKCYPLKGQSLKNEIPFVSGYAWALSRFGCVWLFVSLCTVAHRAPVSMGFCRQKYWRGCHAILQGIFLTQGSNLLFFCLLHWQMNSLPLVPPGKPRFRLQATFFHKTCRANMTKHRKRNRSITESDLFFLSQKDIHHGSGFPCVSP